MRDFTLEDFDRHFGADIDGMGTVSLDAPYIAGDDAVFNAVSGENERLVRARRYSPTGHAQTDGTFFTRRAWVPGDAIVPCAILSGGGLTYRRGAVYTAAAGAASGESFSYIRVRFFACPDDWGTGQQLRFTFRGWAWSPEDRVTGVWTEDERPNGVWVRTGTFSQQTGGVLSE
nr:MAG TPA: hypothetical protein [Caudoviricetes sp.]